MSEEHSSDLEKTEFTSGESIGERIADLVHQQWAHWAWYMLGNLTDKNIKRWRKQMDTPYENLSEMEKDSDRIFVAPYLAIIEEAPIIIPMTEEMVNVLGEAREAERKKIRDVVEGLKKPLPDDPLGQGLISVHNLAIDVAIDAIDA